MSTCGEPCDGCPNRAEHHLCDACCHDEVDAIQKENRELREKLEWQAACTKALMESQERLAAELKEAQAWAKERSEFAAAETEHANRWSVRAHKAEAEVKRLRGLTPEFPPRPPDGEGLPRYGLRWNGPTKPLAVPLADGYWTPWHLAIGTQSDWFTEGFAAGKGEKQEWSDAAFRRGAEAMREAAARYFDSTPCVTTTVQGAIRALPVPEDKP